LIFLGEEWAVLNDEAYLNDPNKAGDSRWIHRPQADWNLFEKEVEKPGTLRNRHFEGLRELFRERKLQPALRGTVLRLLPSENPHVLAYVRTHDSHVLAVLANFSEREQVVDLRGWRPEGLAHHLKDVFAGRVLSTSGVVELAPYEFLWLLED
jgi:amylosucrase